MREREFNLNHQAQPEFLVGVMHVTKEPWLSIAKNGQLPTWENSPYKNFSFIYFFGLANRITLFIDSLIESLRWNKGRYASYGISYFLMLTLRPWLNALPKSKLVDENQSKISAPALRVRVPELTSTMRWKKLAFLEYFLNETNAEYALITTSSSVIHFEPIVDFVRKLGDPSQPLYAGRVCQAHDCEFTSGAFTVLNRKSARLLLESRTYLPVHVMDDVAFGTGFKRLGITPQNLPSLDFDSSSKLLKTPTEELFKVAHFRLKSGPLSSRGDINIMRELLSRIQDRKPDVTESC